MDLSAPLSISPTLTVDQTLEIMDKEGYDQLPVIDETGYVQSGASLIRDILLCFFVSCKDLLGQ